MERGRLETRKARAGHTTTTVSGKPKPRRRPRVQRRKTRHATPDRQSEGGGGGAQPGRVARPRPWRRRWERWRAMVKPVARLLRSDSGVATAVLQEQQEQGAAAAASSSGPHQAASISGLMRTAPGVCPNSPRDRDVRGAAGSRPPSS